jgi:AcrR family transcriptional regulator
LTTKGSKKRGKKTSARKRPQQERSRRRHDAIVEAAAQSFAEFGFDATTMEGIAATASTSIGSVYQFFPNKTAVFREVAQRAIASSGETFAQLLLPGTERSWVETLEQACDLYFELHHRDVRMQAMVRNFQLYREFEADDVAQMDGFIRIIATLLESQSDTLTTEHALRVSRTVVYTFAMSMLLIAREPAEVGRSMLAETKLMLRRYLEAYVPGPG